VDGLQLHRLAVPGDGPRVRGQRTGGARVGRTGLRAGAAAARCGGYTDGDRSHSYPPSWGASSGKPLDERIVGLNECLPERFQFGDDRFRHSKRWNRFSPRPNLPTPAAVGEADRRTTLQAEACCL